MKIQWSIVLAVAVGIFVYGLFKKLVVPVLPSSIGQYVN